MQRSLTPLTQWIVTPYTTMVQYHNQEIDSENNIINKPYSKFHQFYLYMYVYVCCVCVEFIAVLSHV